MNEGFDLSKFKKITEIDISTLTKNEKEQDYAQKNALSVFLRMFDLNKDNKLDNSELSVIFSQIKNFDKNQNSIFDLQETENLLEFTRQNPNISNETKAQLSNIKAKEFVNFFSELEVETNAIQSFEDIIPQNEKTIKKDDIIAGYKAIEDDIMRVTQERHNEVNVYNPKIKGVILIDDDLSELPENALKFARENNLPIFIMGSRK